MSAANLPPCPAPIAAYLQALKVAGCVEALRRVRDAEKWRVDWFVQHDEPDCRCLYGHATDYRVPGIRDQDAAAVRTYQDGQYVTPCWDGFAKTEGLGAAAQVVRAEAARVLEQYHAC